MIVDLHRFVAGGRPFWEELDDRVGVLEADPYHQMKIEDARRLHYLYQRILTDLVKLTSLCAEPELLRYLESLVARAYGEIHESRHRQRRWNLWGHFSASFPDTFRRHIRAFWLSSAIMGLGALFGAGALMVDSEAKDAIIPFEHLAGQPGERVSTEEEAVRDRLRGTQTTFSAYLASHNTRVALLCLALGVTWGVGTAILLFHNGVILGAVSLDYMRGGETEFLLGWLLPHGVIEIPAILIAGQAGLVLASALIGSRARRSLKARLRRIAPDLGALVLGIVVLLLWAGFVEAFLSQYHEPAIPYPLKIGFGLVELAILAVFLARAGREES